MVYEIINSETLERLDDGRLVNFSPRECRICMYLVKRPPRIKNRIANFEETLWGKKNKICHEAAQDI